MKSKRCDICGVKFTPKSSRSSRSTRCEDHRADPRAYMPTPEEIAEECRKIREERVERGEGFRPYVPRVYRVSLAGGMS